MAARRTRALPGNVVEFPRRLRYVTLDDYGKEPASDAGSATIARDPNGTDLINSLPPLDRALAIFAFHEELERAIAAKQNRRVSTMIRFAVERVVAYRLATKGRS